jgi:CRP-like cAMP-binding protein
MTHASIVYEPDQEITHVYFPSTSMISIVATSIDGHSAECGVIGWEGLGGLEALLGHPTSTNRYIVQLEGEAHVADLLSVRRQFSAGGEFQRLVLACVREKMVEMSQTALCNRVHVAEKRLAKWLLMCRDRAPSDVMRITQEFAALMLGTNRVSVTQAAQMLQDHGLIKYNRGRVQVLDRERLEEFSCECYKRVRQEFDRLTGMRPTAG